MTPQEKAEEIFNQYANVIYDRALTVMQYEICKQCALITVNQMIDVAYWHSVKEYLNDVKEKIETL